MFDIFRYYNYKQNLRIAFAIFDETTYAAAQFSSPNDSSASGFLKLFIKTRYSQRNYLGNTVVHGDHKPSFLTAMAKWIRD